MASKLEDALSDTPYSLDSASEEALLQTVTKLEERVMALRRWGTLTDETLQRYYGNKRFEQVAESNAIEGSTLSAGETELAILKGVTIPTTGHDQRYVRDAIALHDALQKLVEMAREPEATDLQQLKSLHALILAGSDSPGVFRTRRVTISGSDHRPPKTWAEVMEAMEAWEAWSKRQTHLPAPIRATVLHAWLAHIHPFADGNGRSSRAISNLELVRAGYPPIIIRRRQDRSRYISALRTSDDGGDIGPMFDLVLERLLGALLGLERSAQETQGYGPATALLESAQRNKTVVWNRSVELLHAIVADQLEERIAPAAGRVRSEGFRDALELEEYLLLCGGTAIPRSWAFRLEVAVPGLKEVERLCWIGYRTPELRRKAPSQSTLPSLFWSSRSNASYPPWRKCVADAPGFMEMSTSPGEGDQWHCIDTNGKYQRISAVELGSRLADAFVALCTA